MADSREEKTDRFVGRQVAAIRSRRRISQQQVADHLKLDVSTYGGMERGQQRIPAGRLYKIAVFLDTPVSSFFPKQNLPATHDMLAPMNGAAEPPKRTRRAASR